MNGRRKQEKKGRLRALFCAAVCVLGFCLAACSPASGQTSFAVHCNGAELTAGISLESALALLEDAGQKPAERQETESCAGEGTDILVTFSSLRLYGFASVDGEAALTGILLTDDGADCDGVKIGMAATQARALLGEPADGSDTCLLYTRGTETLTLTLRDGTVTSVYLTKK